MALELWGDEEVTKLIDARGKWNDEQVKERLEKEIENQKIHSVQYWPIFLLETGEHVGCCGLRSYEGKENTYEIGFHLRSKFWQQGFASEAAKAIIEYAFNTLHASALVAGHNPNNEASKHTLEKFGFIFSHKEYYSPTGLEHLCYVFKKST